MNGIAILAIIVFIVILNNTSLQARIKQWYAKILNKRRALIFDHQYLEIKAFYLYRFKTIPNATLIDGVDVTKSYAYIHSTLNKSIVDLYQNCFYNHSEATQQFYKTILVLDNKVMIELAGQCVRILYPGNRYGFADNIIKALSEYRLPEKMQDFEINIISFFNGCLDLKPLPIQPTVLDLNLHYNDDFIAVDALIRERLNNQQDKGIVLLHGIPGTGKTTYLRHLVGSLKKKVLFLSPSVAGNLMNPDFIDLLIDNPNSILVIEDAENIMMDRKINSGSSVSNLLNLSDGLLSDCLNVQIICTFNSSLNMIDSALMRQGRMIARYEFGKLHVSKAQQLSKHFGFNNVITKPMTIAEIAGQAEALHADTAVRTIGFRQQEPLEN